MGLDLKSKVTPKRIVLILVVTLLAVGSGLGFIYWANQKTNGNINIGNPVAVLTAPKVSIKKFSSDAEFKAYLSSNQGQGLNAPMAMEKMAVTGAALDSAVPMAAPRASETNVQVKGIDEPDIVKVDGSRLFFSPQNQVFYPMLREMKVSPGFVPPMQKVLGIKSIKPLPVNGLKVLAEIDKNGEMLLFGNTLVIFSSDNKIYGFDVTDPAKPAQKWVKTLSSNSVVVGSRKHQNQLFLVTRTNANFSLPCPVRVFDQVTVRCTDIYYPGVPSSADSTFTISKIDPTSGAVNQTASFVGSSSNSIFYMSGSNLYLTYQLETDLIGLLTDFFKEHTDILSAAATDKLIKLSAMDISNEAKMTELSVIFQRFYGSLDESEQLRLQNELNNRMSSFVKQRITKLERTGIAKISVGNLSDIGFGTVPGSPLNQFSLDEYNGYLRVAVTLGGSGRFWGIPYYSGQTESENGVYVLNSNLEEVGSVLGLGQGERIYSARFMGDQAYLVTFRQTDPFYVLDLKNPSEPKMAGQLKIPGYSGYLEEIKLNYVLGVGMEGSEVKLSLFDVSNPQLPVEIDKYLLSENWTEVNNNHHAFLLDRANNSFFLPGGRGGYIFSYLNNKLKLVKAVSETNLRRAVYINNYYYLIADQKITVLSSPTWDEVGSLEL